MAYRGKYRPVNREKYEGDFTSVRYRSLWERQVMKWADHNSDIVSWSSEEVVIPYRSTVDRKMHRYYMDFKLTYADGHTVLVEVKPLKQTKLPKKPVKKRSRRYINEVRTFAVNTSKWVAAEAYALDRGWAFEIWTEKTLKAMGIKILKG